MRLPAAHLPISLCLQTVFLLWNSLNDPLFGWLSDRQFLSSQPRFVSWGQLITAPVPPLCSPELEDHCPCFGWGKRGRPVEVLSMDPLPSGGLEQALP
jgi:hypothetical protein